jgi:thioredoxin reductase
MQQNKLYDVIILGASSHGLALAEMIEDSCSTALVSSNFTHKTKKQSLDYTDLIQGTAVYLSYMRGLFVLSLENREKVVGKNLVIATGTRPKKSALRNQNIRYNISELTEKNKIAQAVVYGHDELAVQYSISLAKLFRYVYLCSDTFELDCSKKVQKQLNELINVVHLPGCTVLSCKNDAKGQLVEITLDTYDTIKTSTLIMSIGRLPDLPSFLNQYIKKDSEGYAITKEYSESTTIPKVYAIGGLLKKSTKKSLTTLAIKLKEETVNA